MIQKIIQYYLLDHIIDTSTINTATKKLAFRERENEKKSLRLYVGIHLVTLKKVDMSQTFFKRNLSYLLLATYLYLFKITHYLKKLCLYFATDYIKNEILW